MGNQSTGAPIKESSDYAEGLKRSQGENDPHPYGQNEGNDEPQRTLEYNDNTSGSNKEQHRFSKTRPKRKRPNSHHRKLQNPHHPKYMSIRQSKGLSIKPRNATTGEGSLHRRNNLNQQRARLVMNNESKIRNMFKMIPSKPILSSVLKR
mmetsp:Transcript_6841/g.6366  ORF Transcript_6841/g.6366 Transcript_6841/m.6366 type:complete len:150 (-) Transcript_6841:2-451(-)